MNTFYLLGKLLGFEVRLYTSEPPVNFGEEYRRALWETFRRQSKFEAAIAKRPS